MSKPSKRLGGRRDQRFLTVKDILKEKGKNIGSILPTKKDEKGEDSPVLIIKEVEISIHQQASQSCVSSIINLKTTKQKENIAKMVIVDDKDFASFMESKNHDLANKISRNISGPMVSEQCKIII